MIDIEEIKVEEHYDIPDGYFENLPHQVMASIRKEKSKRRNLWIASVAAVMLAVVCTTIVVRYTGNDQQQPQKVAEIQDEQNQLENQVIDYYNNEFAQIDYIY